MTGAGAGSRLSCIFTMANSDVSGICPTDPEHAEPVQQSTKSLYIHTACISIQHKGWEGLPDRVRGCTGDFQGLFEAPHDKALKRL